MQLVKKMLKNLLNALFEIKKTEIIKYKKHTPGLKKLLNLFNKLLNIILTDKTSESQENEKVEDEDEDETMSQKIIKN